MTATDTQRRKARVRLVVVVVIVAATAAGLNRVGESGEPDSPPTGEATYEQPPPDLSEDPDAPLRLWSGTWLDGPLPWTSSLSWWNETHPVTTFGTIVCNATDDPVTITDVAPLQTIGNGFRLVGTLLHTAPMGTPGGGFRPGFPPDVEAGQVGPLEGAPLTAPCGRDADIFDDILIGLEGTGPAGGGWRGMIVSYTTVDGHSYQLHVPYEMLMCGTTTERCGEPDY